MDSQRIAPVTDANVELPNVPSVPEAMLPPPPQQTSMNVEASDVARSTDANAELSNIPSIPEATLSAPPQQAKMNGKTSGDKKKDSYTRIRGSRLADRIERGCMQIVKGEYFEHCWTKQTKISMRQDIPAEFLWDGRRAVDEWASLGAAFLIVISYAWISPEHPDPDLFHLRRLARIVHLHRTWHSGRNKRKPLEDLGIIMDYCALWQRKMCNGVDMRTPEQVQEFKKGLAVINTPYAHKEVTACMLQDLPNEVFRKYEDRGWTLFEKVLMDGKARSRKSLVLNVLTFSELFDPEQDDKQLLKYWERNSSSMKSHRLRRPPLTPERFEKAMDARGAAARQKNVNLFTNGKEDLPFVINKYKEAFDILTEATAFAFHSLGWGPEEMSELKEVLLRCPNLNQLNIGENNLGDEGADMVLEVLKKVAPLKELNINGNKISRWKIAQLAHAWRMKQPAYVHCTSFCCCDCVPPFCCCSGCGCCGTIQIHPCNLSWIFCAHFNKCPYNVHC